MQEFFNWQGVVGTIFGLIGLYFSWNAWNESKQAKKLLEEEILRSNEKIRIFLTDGKNTQELPSLRRQDVTRSEIQGRLGTIPMKKKGTRYSIEYVSSADFIKQIDKIAEESGQGTLMINCSTVEFNQFKFDSITNLNEGCA
jgi:hypothetical protein